MTTFSTTIPYVASDIEDDKNVYQSKSTSGVIRQRATPGQLYLFSLKFRSMKKAEAFPIIAFFEGMAGESFNVLHPDHKTPLGSPSGTPVIKGAGQTGKSVLTDGWPVSTVGLMLAGDIVSFGANGSKVYRLFSDVDSDSGGNATLTLVHDLASSPADNAAINHTGVLFNCVMKNRIRKYSTNNNNIYSYEIPLVESL